MGNQHEKHGILGVPKLLMEVIYLPNRKGGVLKKVDEKWRRCLFGSIWKS
jgi:hypothetical protein